MLHWVTVSQRLEPREAHVHRETLQGLSPWWVQDLPGPTSVPVHAGSKGQRPRLSKCNCKQSCQAKAPQVKSQERAKSQGQKPERASLHLLF